MSARWTSVCCGARSKKRRPAAVLDAGTGTGNVIAALRARYPRAALYALDIALAMVRRVRSAVPWWQRVRRRGVLAPGGLLMFSTFGPDTLKELRAAYAGADRYTHVNRFVDMHDLGDMLVHAGFAAPVMDMEY